MSKESTITIIKDSLMEPFYVSRDSHCYTVYENITPDARYTENNKPGKDYSKVVGHYSSFGSCLARISKEQVNLKSQYDSIKGYLTEFRKIETNLKQLTNIGL